MKFDGKFFQTLLLSYKVCRLISSVDLLREFTIASETTQLLANVLGWRLTSQQV